MQLNRNTVGTLLTPTQEAFSDRTITDETLPLALIRRSVAQGRGAVTPYPCLWFSVRELALGPCVRATCWLAALGPPEDLVCMVVGFAGPGVVHPNSVG